MVAYSFQKRFIAPILSGRKAQTIRAVGKRRHARPGDFLQLYSGMRTKHCRLILETRCVSVHSITIVTGFAWSVTIDGDYRLTSLDEFAQRDGFAHLADMQAFWAKHHPDVVRFDGWLIEWKPPAAVVEMGTSILQEAT